jgi:hypothetical protein
MMHITVSRVLGFLLFLALIGYAFFVGPRISTLSLRPAPGTGSTTGLAQLVYLAPHPPAQVPLASAE